MTDQVYLKPKSGENRMKTFSIVAIVLGTIGAAAFMNRDKLVPLASKIKPAMDKFAAGRVETATA